MGSLDCQNENSYCRISHFRGSARFIGRITAMGLTIGTVVEIVQNRKYYPLLLFARDTMLAVSRKEARNILVEEA
ncbi:MAG TPA: ferrous iron transport protein A [Selenomonadales bacterium]|nr:ferrous iron transport protein A [Selenomonadales bacterium]